MTSYFTFQFEVGESSHSMEDGLGGGLLSDGSIQQSLFLTYRELQPDCSA